MLIMSHFLILDRKTFIPWSPVSVKRFPVERCSWPVLSALTCFLSKEEEKVPDWWFRKRS